MTPNDAYKDSKTLKNNEIPKNINRTKEDQVRDESLFSMDVSDTSQRSRLLKSISETVSDLPSLRLTLYVGLDPFNICTQMSMFQFIHYLFVPILRIYI